MGRRNKNCHGSKEEEWNWKKYEVVDKFGIGVEFVFFDFQSNSGPVAHLHDFFYQEASDSTQMDLDNPDLELDVEKNADKRAKRKTAGSKRKAPTKKKPKTKGQEQKSKWWKFFDIQCMKKMKTETK
ncbi:hypothetical protein Tco_1150863 [Tanacetum coccineum]